MPDLSEREAKADKMPVLRRQLRFLSEELAKRRREHSEPMRHGPVKEIGPGHPKASAMKFLFGLPSPEAGMLPFGPRGFEMMLRLYFLRERPDANKLIDAARPAEYVPEHLLSPH
jgi:hypothetical protein